MVKRMPPLLIGTNDCIRDGQKHASVIDKNWTLHCWVVNISLHHWGGSYGEHSLHHWGGSYSEHSVHRWGGSHGEHWFHRWGGSYDEHSFKFLKLASAYSGAANLWLVPHHKVWTVYSSAVNLCKNDFRLAFWSWSNITFTFYRGCILLTFCLSIEKNKLASCIDSRHVLTRVMTESCKSERGLFIDGNLSKVFFLFCVCMVFPMHSVKT